MSAVSGQHAGALWTPQPILALHTAAYRARAAWRAQLHRDPEARRHVRHGRTLRGRLSRGFRGPILPHRFCGGILLHEVKILKNNAKPAASQERKHLRFG